MRRQPEIRLVGHGLDAILFPAAQPRTWWERLICLRARPDDDLLRPASPSARLNRYRDATLFRPMYRDQRLLDLREQRGCNYQAAWINRRFPKVGQMKRACLAVVRREAPTARAAVGRG